MGHLIQGARTGRLLAALLALAAGLAACGSSSSSGAGSARTLLQQTFSGSHTVTSGNVGVSLQVQPSGSSTLSGPISLSFGGPFQSQGAGRLPKSNFNVTISAMGKSASLGILSTGSRGYVTLDGTSYALPQATFRQLESSFAGLASSPGGGSGSGTLSKLGIHPLDWLSNPSVVGSETVAGTQTTHITARVNVASLLGDLSTFLGKASALKLGTGKIPTSISPATRQKIAGEVQNPTFDVWTGQSDKTIRKLAIALTLPVSGQAQSQLGGLRSARIALTMQYANLGKPQTITAPTTVKPISEFTAKIQGLLGSVQGLTGGATTGSPSGASGSGAAGSTASGSAAATATDRYSQCLLKASGDVTKMQRCASLVNGG